MDKGAAVLRRLSAKQLDHLEAGVLPPAEYPVSDELVKPIFLDALRGQLPAERLRRAGLAAAEKAEVERRAREKAARETRVRDSAPYKDMVELAANLTKRYEEDRLRLDKQKRALERLIGELRLEGKQEARLRKEMDNPEKLAASLKKTFAERRNLARKVFKELDGFTADDLALFDALLGRLAETLPGGGKS
jgi:predicted RNase H-like nuclease (RuvC/YqgF family)